MSMEAIESVVAFDASLSSLFASYQEYVAMGLAVAGALVRFISDDHDGAVVALLKYKQLHGTWRSSLMMGAHWQFTSVLDMLDFNDLAIAFGTRCIQTLNREAYDKASSIAQCTEGLHQAARLANLAQLLVAAPKTAQGDRLLADMSDLWLRFSDMLGANALTADQSNLLSGLIMIYLDGPAHANLAALRAEIDKTQLPDTAILQKYTTLLDDARARL
ncbi:hypothetical protein BC940DRAFT_6602 [Gongronella butleri]|nr:hypothetical protein BC940DRAFT_6602 [Gongronella butleri]